MLRHVHEAVTKCIDAAVTARSQRQKACHINRLSVSESYVYILTAIPVHEMHSFAEVEVPLIRISAC